MSSAVSTSLAPCLISAWQPARLRRVDRAGNGEHLAPGFGGQPRGDQRARLQRRLDHQRALASGPAMMRLRCGKCAGSGGVPSANSLTSSAVLRRCGAPARGGAAGRRGPARCRPRRWCRPPPVQRAFVGGAVDAQRQARTRRPARRWPGCGAKARALSRALRRGVAAADDGQRWRGAAGRASPCTYSSSGGSAVCSSSGRVGGVAQRQHVARRLAAVPARRCALRPGASQVSGGAAAAPAASAAPASCRAARPARRRTPPAGEPKAASSRRAAVAADARRLAAAAARRRVRRSSSTRGQTPRRRALRAG